MVVVTEKIEGPVPLKRPHKWVGAPIKCKEDLRFLTGRGTFVDDIKLPQMLYAAVLRSPYAHARIKSVDTTQALKAPGVEAVIEGREVATMMKPLPYSSPDIPVSEYPIAVDKVRYQGEAVAVVAASSRALAEDALELIEVEYEPLPSVVDAKKAMEKDSPLIYEKLGSNIFWHTKLEYGKIKEAFQEADLILKETFTLHRYSSTPLETHACLANYNPTDGSLTIYCNAQGGEMLRWIEDALSITKTRMIIPDIGGGFGPKSYCGKGLILLMCLLSIKTGRPVKGVEDRREHLMAGGHQCDTELQAEAAVSSDGRFLALKLTDIVNEGGNPSFAVYHTTNKLSNLQGAYKAKGLALEGYSVLTNKGPGAANRGIGKPAMCMVWERMMDIAARRLKLDPAEIRQRNFIQPHEFPYHALSGNILGSGDFPRVFKEALSIAGYEKLREQRELRKGNKRIGIGLSTSAEPGGRNMARQFIAFNQVLASGSTSAATIRITLSGKVRVLVDVPCCGQGHETTISQIVADELSTTPDDVYVVPGFDTNANPVSGDGLNASNNFTPFTVGAVVGAARRIREKILTIASHLLGATEDELTIEDGVVYVKNEKNKAKTYAEIAKVAYRHLSLLPPNLEPGLHTTYFYSYPGSKPADQQTRQVRSQISYSFSTHVAVVEVDIETGLVKVLRYVIASDHGVVVNPMIVEGLIQGAAASSISAALGEEYIYNEDGQLLTSTFADYLKMGAVDTPKIEVEHHIRTPDPIVALGSKVVGEGASLLAPAAIANAVEDALAEYGVKILDLPITPEKLLLLIDAAEQKKTSDAT